MACQPINGVGNRTAAIQSNWRMPPLNTIAREPRRILQWHSNSYGFYEKHSWTEINHWQQSLCFHYHGLLNRPRRAASETRIVFCAKRPSLFEIFRLVLSKVTAWIPAGKSSRGNFFIATTKSSLHPSKIHVKTDQ